VVGYIEPRPGIPPTPSHTIELVNMMKRDNVKLMLIEPYFDLKTPNSVASMTNGKVLQMMPSVGGKPEITDYFKLFDYDIALLKQALDSTR
jgi:ABC-type Zn uptake system ZnuABC Zn-binding protein ZnuA